MKRDGHSGPDRIHPAPEAAEHPEGSWDHEFREGWDYKKERRGREPRR